MVDVDPVTCLQRCTVYFHVTVLGRVDFARLFVDEIVFVESRVWQRRVISNFEIMLTFSGFLRSATFWSLVFPPGAALAALTRASSVKSL